MSSSKGSHRASGGMRGGSGTAAPPAVPFRAVPPFAAVPFTALPPAGAPDGGAVPRPARAAAGLPGPRRPTGHRAAHGRHAAARPDPLRRLLPQAVVVAVLAGGTCAVLAGDKEIRLSVDGRQRTVYTFAGTVPDLLREQHVGAGPHDLVRPGPKAALRDGEAVDVRHARPVELTIDGRPQRMWTTATTVAGVLRQLGTGNGAARVFAVRAEPSGRRGMELALTTERTVVVAADGREHRLRTSARTVRRAITEAGVVLGPADTASAPLGSFPEDGQTITVTRAAATRVRDEPIPYRTVDFDDPALPEGTRLLQIRGRDGVEQVTYAYRVADGIRRAPRRVGTRVLREPVDEVVRVGTASAPGPVGRGHVPDRLDWHALARCEAGGRPHAVDAAGRHGGLYQFDSRTWHAVGGSGRPQDAPRTEQTYRAKKLYVLRGTAAWPACGRRLYR